MFNNLLGKADSMNENINIIESLRPLIARLINNFLSGDYEQRKESAIAISKFKGKKSTDFLLETYESDNIQDFMALALGNVESDKVINLLVNALNDSQQEVRFNAAQALGMMENPEAFNVLMEALNEYADSCVSNPDEEEAQDETNQIFFEEEAIISAIVALGKIKNRLAISLLKRLLAQEKSPRIRASIIMALGMMPSDRMLPVFQSALRDEDPRVRANAIEAIESIKSGSIVGIVQPYLEDPNNRVRANVAKAIWKYGDFDVSDTLKQMIKSNDKWYRASAAYAIGEIKDARFIKQLAKALRDEEPDVRRNATNALRKIEYKEAFPHLKPLMNDPNFDVRVQATLAINRCAPEKAPKIFEEKLMEEENFIVQATLISCLGDCGSSGVIPLIEKHLDSEDPRVVSNSIDALVKITKIPDENLINKFKSLLDHEDNRIKSTAIRALWSCGTYNVLDRLREMFASKQIEKIKSATFVLGEIGEQISQTMSLANTIDEMVAELFENPSEIVKVVTVTDEGQDASQTDKENQTKVEEPAPPVVIQIDKTYERDIEFANNAVGAKEYEAAEDTYLKILEQQPNHHKAILGIANLYFFQKKYKESAQYYEKAIELNPNLVKAHYNLGTLRFYAKKYDSAVRHLTYALKLYPKILGAYLILAQIYQNAGKTSDSVKLLTKAAHLSPRNPIIYQKLAMLHIQTSQFSSAIKVLSKAIELSPADVESNLLLAYCFKQVGEIEKAFSAMDLTLKACAQSTQPENSVKQLLRSYLYINSIIEEKH